MKNADKITEKVFEMAADRKLAVHLLNAVPDRDFEKGIMLHAVYTNDDAKSLIYHCKFKDSESSIKRNFKSELGFFMEKYKPESKGINDFLFFLGMFNPVNRSPTIKTIYRYQYREFPVLSDILAESRGSLLWDHQLDSLCGLFSEIENSERWLRNGLNRKDQLCQERAKGYKFNEDLSLFDVVSSRMLMGKTSKPNYRGAYILLKTFGILK